MYKIALQTLKANYAFYGLIVVVLVVMEQFFKINAGASLVLGTMLALYSHRMILLNENYGGADLFNRNGPNGQKLPMLSFFLVSGIGFLIFMLLGIVVLYLWFFLLLGVNLGDKEQLAEALKLSQIPAAFFYGIVLSLVGTVFPAVAIGADRSVKTAFKRGKLGFWKTFGRLVIGPVALTLVGGWALRAVTIYMKNAGSNISGATVEIPLSVLEICIHFGVILLGVTALSMAYQSAEAPQ